jgi:hypothetical protein
MHHGGEAKAEPLHLGDERGALRGADGADGEMRGGQRPQVVHPVNGEPEERRPAALALPVLPEADELVLRAVSDEVGDLLGEESCPQDDVLGAARHGNRRASAEARIGAGRPTPDAAA